MSTFRLPHILRITISLLSLFVLVVSTVGEEKPNVLFIGVDDLRPELNCYGIDYIHSPNIDRLASEGILFNRAYCQQAVCMPSRASLLTGLRPDSFNGVARGFRSVVPDVVTLPQHFKNHGYFTQSFGKIYHGTWLTAYVGSSFQDPISWSVPRMAPSPQYYFSPEGIRIAKEVFATIGHASVAHEPEGEIAGDKQRFLSCSREEGTERGLEGPFGVSCDNAGDC